MACRIMCGWRHTWYEQAHFDRKIVQWIPKYMSFHLSVIFIVLYTCSLVRTVSGIISSWGRSRIWTILFSWWGITSCRSSLLHLGWGPSCLGLRLVMAFFAAVAIRVGWWWLLLNHPVHLRRRLSGSLLSLGWAMVGLWGRCCMSWCGSWPVRLGWGFYWIRFDWSGRSGRSGSWPWWGRLSVSRSWLWWGSVSWLRRWSWSRLSWWSARSCLPGSLIGLRSSKCRSSCFLWGFKGISVSVAIRVVSLRISSRVVWTFVVNGLNWK